MAACLFPFIVCSETQRLNRLLMNAQWINLVYFTAVPGYTVDPQLFGLWTVVRL